MNYSTYQKIKQAAKEKLDFAEKYMVPFFGEAETWEEEKGPQEKEEAQQPN